MGVYRVQHRPTPERTIHEPPYFDVAELRIGVDSVRVERFVVDHPLKAGGDTDGWPAAEDERSRPPRLPPLEGLEFREPFRNPAVIPFRAADVETHDAPKRVVGALVQEDDAGADRIDRKIDDHIGPFRHRESNARQGHR